MNILIFLACTALSLGTLTWSNVQRNKQLQTCNTAAEHKYPHQVSLQVLEYGEWTPYCSGSIIGRSKVVTSAGCAERTEYFLDRSLEYRLVAGVHNLSADESEFQQIRFTKKVARHPAYDQATLDNDFAVITVDNAWQFNQYVSAIRLPKKTFIPEGNCASVGWSPNDVTSLRLVNLTVVNRTRCKEIFLERLTDGMICASPGCAKPIGFKIKEEFCYPDDGGPLVCDNILAGVSSWNRDPCSDNSPGVFSNIAAAVDWIHSE